MDDVIVTIVSNPYIPSGAVINLGDYDASTNLFPNTPLGSGTGGIILKANQFRISVAGAPGGLALGVGAIIQAKIDNPGQTVANWIVITF